MLGVKAPLTTSRTASREATAVWNSTRRTAFWVDRNSLSVAVFGMDTTKRNCLPMVTLKFCPISRASIAEGSVRGCADSACAGAENNSVEITKSRLAHREIRRSVVQDITM